MDPKPATISLGYGVFCASGLSICRRRPWGSLLRYAPQPSPRSTVSHHLFVIHSTYKGWGVQYEFVVLCVEAFPVGFPLVAVDDGAESGHSVGALDAPAGGGLFEPAADQAVMVKRLTAGVRKPFTSPLPTVEGSYPEPTAPIAHIEDSAVL